MKMSDIFFRQVLELLPYSDTGQTCGQLKARGEIIQIFCDNFFQHPIVRLLTNHDIPPWLLQTNPILHAAHFLLNQTFCH